MRDGAQKEWFAGSRPVVDLLAHKRMPYVLKELYATHDWRGEKAPSLWDTKLEWHTVVPSITGKVLLIEFWATWCHKCHQKVPLLNEIQQIFKDDVVVIGLTDEQGDLVLPWMKQYNVEYSIATDLDGKFRDQIGIDGTPNILVIDTEGVVQWQGLPNANDRTDPFNKEVVQQIINMTKLSKLPAAKFVPITETLISASQPNIEQLKNLGVIGIKSVLNLRTNEEKGIIPNEEKLLNTGIEYSQIPILYLSDMDESNVNNIMEKISTLPKPCLVHCNVGLCACAAILLHVANEEKKNGAGVSRQQFLEWGAGLGFNFTDQPKFYEFLGRHLG